MRKDILNRFKKAVNNMKAIEKWLEKMSDKSFVKYSLKGIEFEREVRAFYDKNIKYYRWLLNL